MTALVRPIDEDVELLDLVERAIERALRPTPPSFPDPALCKILRDAGIPFFVEGGIAIVAPADLRRARKAIEDEISRIRNKS